MKKELPTLRGEALYIPFVGAIIERMNGTTKEILIQVREKSSDRKYSGSIEIPGGKMRAFEDVYETLRREVKEETGLDLVFVQYADQRQDYVSREDCSSFIQPFCVTQMQQGPYIGLIFLCAAKGTLLEKTDESKEIRWIACGELKAWVDTHPERVYTAFLAPLKKYLG